MTTKEQEKKALSQIKKIVESLGESSYLATAFDGCFEDADQNIEYDAAFSMKSRWEYEGEKNEKLEKELQEAKDANSKLTERAERAEAAAMGKDLVLAASNDYRQLIHQKSSELRGLEQKVLGMIGTVQPTDDEFVSTFKKAGQAKDYISYLKSVKEKIDVYL